MHLLRGICGYSYLEARALCLRHWKEVAASIIDQTVE